MRRAGNQTAALLQKPSENLDFLSGLLTGSDTTLSAGVFFLNEAAAQLQRV